MKNKINLLLPKEQDLSDKILYFSLHYLRYILVITQIVVIGVFFYRFQIDQQIIDLKDELVQKQEIVAVSQPLVDEARSIDRKIKSSREILQRQEDIKGMTNYLFSLFPKGLHLTDMKIGINMIDFRGISDSPVILQLFLNRLRKDSRFNSIELKNINKTTNGFSFSFTLADYKNKLL